MTRPTFLARCSTSTLMGLAFTIPAALIAGLLLLYHYDMAQRYLSEEGARYGQVLADPILGASRRYLREGSIPAIQQMMEDAGRNAVIGDIALFDGEGRVVASNHTGWTGRVRAELSLPGYERDADEARRTGLMQHRLCDRGAHLVLLAAITPGPDAGILYMKIDQQQRLREISSGILKRGIASAFGIVAVSLLLFVWVRAILARPMLEIAAFVRALASGEAGAPPRSRGPLEVEALREDILALAENLDAKERALEASHRLVREAERMESVASLAGALAHDFNNLLTGILGYSRLLLDRIGPGDPIRRQLAAIEASASRAADLTARLLTFSRRGASRPTPADVSEALAPAILALRDGLPEGIRFSVERDPELWTVAIDVEQIRRVLGALGSNALEAMGWGGTITVVLANRTITEQDCRGRLDARPGRFVVLSVADTGTGIDKEVRRRLFEPFVTTKKGTGSAGFGLATAYGLVKGHEGWIEVESEIGKGTTFTVYLPACPPGTTVPAAGEAGAVEDAAGTAAVPLASGAAEPAEPAAGPTILAVDDESTVLALARDVLEMHGYRVLTARNGEEALRVYREHRDTVSLVLLDLTMPVMGGVECFRRMKEMDASVRVVISSGFSSESTAAEVLKEGALDYLQKPYDIEHLARIVAKALARPWAATA
ncbi:MAG TPA: response regulator [Candidatus Polarisedimenticolia bacterium]|jgi:signal transduction histidine kinase/ActR/RegA family two-component response regulator|nr:response regulator [Candidatus Polarisedimenticolia bacterium]